MPEEELDHVWRPVPPWREERLTECGLDGRNTRVINRDAFIAKVKTQGKTRSAMTTCMTCWHTAARNGAWDKNPSAVIARDINVWHQDRKALMNAELRALAALVAQHPEEFYGYLEDLKGTLPLDEARKKRAQRQAAGTPKPRGL